MFQKVVRLLFIGVITLSLISCDEGTSEPVDNGPSNMVLNSTFEGGSDGEPTYWTAHQTGNYQLAWTTETAGAGSYSLKISNNTADPDSSAYWYQNQCMYIPVNQTVTLKAKIKLDNVVGTGATIVIIGNDREYNIQYYATTLSDLALTGTHDWQEYSMQLENFNNLILCLNIYLVLPTNTTGTVYFDDVRIEY